MIGLHESSHSAESKAPDTPLPDTMSNVIGISIAEAARLLCGEDGKFLESMAGHHGHDADSSLGGYGEWLTGEGERWVSRMPPSWKKSNTLRKVQTVIGRLSSAEELDSSQRAMWGALHGMFRNHVSGVRRAEMSGVVKDDVAEDGGAEQGEQESHEDDSGLVTAAAADPDVTADAAPPAAPARRPAGAPRTKAAVHGALQDAEREVARLRREVERLRSRERARLLAVAGLLEGSSNMPGMGRLLLEFCHSGKGAFSERKADGNASPEGSSVSEEEGSD